MLASDAFQWKEVITFGIALLGSGLGIMNTWNAISQRRVNLRVRPLSAIPTNAGPIMFCIEVVNLSGFAVTITDIGFTTGWRGIHDKSRLSLLQPIMIDGKTWPRRLESRESAAFYFYPREVIRHGKKIRKAYAKTACGEGAYGMSPALKQLRDAVSGMLAIARKAG